MTSTRVVLFSEVNSKFGEPILRRLLDDPAFTVMALVTSPVGTLCDYYVDEPDPVDLAAIGRVARIPVMRPERVNRETLTPQLQALRPDYFIIANYQQIMSAPLLQVPVVGAVNFHPSPLPRYAGLAPFFWMAKNNERDGGVSAVWTGTGIDDGPLLAQRELILAGTETAAQIRKSHFDASWQLVDEVLPTLIDRSFRRTPQDLRHRSYYGRPGAPDHQVELTAPTRQVLGTIRASSPLPGATVRTVTGQTMRVLDAEPADDIASVSHPSPGMLYRHAGQLVACTGGGWLRITRIEVSDAVLASCLNQVDRQPSLVS
jgi:methionyl-tRNA formyltransferase